MTSHSRRTHLDIFCKLCFAPGFLQKIPSNLAPSSQTLSQQTVPLKKDLERLFTWFLLLLCCPKLHAFFTSLETETSTGRSPPGSLPSLEHTHKCVLPLPTEHEMRGKERVSLFSLCCSMGEASLSARFFMHFFLENHEDKGCLSAVISFFAISTHRTLGC